MIVKCVGYIHYMELSNGLIFVYKSFEIILVHLHLEKTVSVSFCEREDVLCEEQKV